VTKTPDVDMSSLEFSVILSLFLHIEYRGVVERCHLAPRKWNIIIQTAV